MKQLDRHLVKTKEQEQYEQQMKKKRAAAKKLMNDKEKLIQAGIKDRLHEIEQEHVDHLLNAALGLSVEEEIERRIRGARRAYQSSIDESSKNYD